MANEHPFKLWRKEHRITLAAIAGRVGVSASHLSEVENFNNTPSLELASKLSRETAGADGVPEVRLDAFVPQSEAAQ